MRDVEFLKIPSTPMTKEDLYIVDDLIDTLKHHQEKCVGMAANMIGFSKNVIVVMLNNGEILPMLNPQVIMQKDLYKTEEGCLSLDGTRKTTRYKKIKVQFYDKNFKIKIKTFNDFEAQIVQHEMDHLYGKII